MSSVPILLYHHVAPDREVTPEGFDRQLAWLKAEGWRCLSLAELERHGSGEQPAPPRSLVLTFDDAYADNWVYATPLLRRRGLRAVLFAPTAYLGDSRTPRPTSEDGGRLEDTRRAERAPQGFLSWGELKAMSDSQAWEIGSHTHSHKDFSRESPYQDLGAELRRSRDLLESRLGRWSGALAWPWGDYERSWLPLLAPAGYSLAFTARPGSNAPGGGALDLRRFKVPNEDLGWLERRLWVYSRPAAARLYGAVYGLGRR